MSDSTDLIKHNRVVYNRIAEHFSATREYNWADVIALVDYTKPSDTVLDLGCGNGRLYQMLAKKQVEYVGVDQSEELITLAKKKYPDAEFVVGEMSAFNFSAEMFDDIFCIAAFNHIPGEDLQIQCLQEMRRVLKLGGHLFMTNWNLHSRSAQENIKKHCWKILPDIKNSIGIDIMVPWKNSEGQILGERYYHGFTIPELMNLFNAVGFKIEDQYYSKKGARVGIEEGGNIISIISKL